MFSTAALTGSHITAHHSLLAERINGPVMAEVYYPTKGELLAEARDCDASIQRSPR